MAKIDVSVIIPVYNAEKYVERCAESVVGALKNFNGKSEILITDNDSQDDSLKIIQKLAKKYPKLIRVLQCHTPGAGAVRNYAVREAKGEYFWFIDADDEVTPDSVNKLMHEARKSGADFVMLGLSKVFPDGHTDLVPAFSPQKPDFASRFIRSELGPVQVFVRREWYLKHDFRFLEGIIHEDMDMMPALMLYTDKISYIDEPLYIYYQNPDSVLHKLEWTEHYFDIFPALESLYRRFDEVGAVKKYHAELEWFFIWNLLMDSAEYYTKFPEGREGLKRSREMLKKYFPHWRKNKFLKNCNLRTRLKIILNYYK